jgi:hypothetical protein
VAQVLSQEWLDRQLTRGDEEAAEAAAVSGVVQHVVSGAPDGTVSYWIRYDGGRVVEAAFGQAESPDLTFQVGYDDAVRIDRDELELSAAYMQGRLKADGDMTMLLALLAGDHLARTRT